MDHGRWERPDEIGRFAIFHLPFAMQDALFSILLDPVFNQYMTRHWSAPARQLSIDPAAVRDPARIEE